MGSNSQRGIHIDFKSVSPPLPVMLVDSLMCIELIENWLKSLGIYNHQKTGPKLLG